MTGQKETPGPVVAEKMRLPEITCPATKTRTCLPLQRPTRRQAGAPNPTYVVLCCGAKPLGRFRGNKNEPKYVARLAIGT